MLWFLWYSFLCPVGTHASIQNWPSGVRREIALTLSLVIAAPRLSSVTSPYRAATVAQLRIVLKLLHQYLLQPMLVTILVLNLQPTNGSLHLPLSLREPPHKEPGLL